MTPKERMYNDLPEIARRWECDGTIETLAKDYGSGKNTLSALLIAHFGKARYREIVLEHRKTNCFSKGRRYQYGNKMYRRRKRNAGFARSPIGAIVVRNRHDGPRRYVKVSHSRRPDGWRPVSQAIWEKLHGPIPAGHIVVYIDGDRLNDDPSNYKLVSRAENARTVTYRCDTKERVAKIRETKERRATQRRLAQERLRKLLSMKESAA